MYGIGGRIATAALVLGLSLVGNASAGVIYDLSNVNEPFPSGFSSGALTSFTLVFQGNVIDDIDLSTTENDKGTNAYLFLNDLLGNGTTSVTATLDGNGNTDVTFTGSNGILASDAGEFSGQGGTPHFGVDELSTAPASLVDIGSFWTDSSSTLYALPDLSVIAPPVQSTAPNVKYATIFADVTAGGNTVGEWFEIPYVNALPTIQLSNGTNSDFTLSNVGFLLSPTEIPLDNLNFGTEPPPGTSGSMFTPLPSLDGLVDPSGGSLVVSPEPSSFITALSAGILGLLILSRRRRIARNG